MKISRRELLCFGALQIASLAYASEKNDTFLSPPVSRNYLKPSVLQGVTDESSVQFNIVFDKNILLDFYVIDQFGEMHLPEQIKEIEKPKHFQKIYRLFFKNLNLKNQYQLVIVNKIEQRQIDLRHFQLIDTNKESIKFALCSCMDDRHHRPEIWQDLVAKKPDIIFFVGDFVYADSRQKGSGDNRKAATPDRLWSRFCEARSTLHIFFSPTLIPILATWDDHDFGLNDSNSENFPYVAESQKNFEAFFAQDPEFSNLINKGPGVSLALKLSNQNFFLLDDRSFRKPKYSSDRYAHWGKDQEEWMLDLISQNKKCTNWIMNGSQVFPKLIFKESLSGNHKEQFNGFMNELKNTKTKNIFVSGDVHFSELSKIPKSFLGYETYEITSSSIHSKNVPGSPHVFPNPYRTHGTGARNYIMVESKQKSETVQANIICYNQTGRKEFQTMVEV